MIATAKRATGSVGRQLHKPKYRGRHQKHHSGRQKNAQKSQLYQTVPIQLPALQVPGSQFMPDQNAAPLLIPLQRQQIRSRTTDATEFAAAASVPIHGKFH